MSASDEEKSQDDHGLTSDRSLGMTGRSDGLSNAPGSRRNKSGIDSGRKKLKKKVEPFMAKKAHAQIDEVDEDDDEMFYGDKVRGDKLEIFEFVKPT